MMSKTELCGKKIELAREHQTYGDEMIVTMACSRPKDHPGQHMHSGETENGDGFTLLWYTI